MHCTCKGTSNPLTPTAKTVGCLKIQAFSSQGSGGRSTGCRWTAAPRIHTPVPTLEAGSAQVPPPKILLLCNYSLQYQSSSQPLQKAEPTLAPSFTGICEVREAKRKLTSMVCMRLLKLIDQPDSAGCVSQLSRPETCWLSLMGFGCRLQHTTTCRGIGNATSDVVAISDRPHVPRRSARILLRCGHTAAPPERP